MTDREALASLLHEWACAWVDERPPQRPWDVCPSRHAEHADRLLAAGVRLDRTPAVGDEGLRAAVQEISEGEERPVHLEGDSR